MRPRVDLFLLRDSLLQLAETTYFSGRLHEFTNRLVAAIDHVLANEKSFAGATMDAFAKHIRAAQHYLAGSTTKEAPYEIEFCLNAALRPWVQRECLITTALTAHQDFHFLPADPWDFIRKRIASFDSSGFDAMLVLIGVPRIYSHKPIFCIPLYHELGHFVDVALGVVNLSLLLDSPKGPMPQARAHRHEHFADLFAASYVGPCSTRTLETIAPHAPASITHPATDERKRIVEAFLSGAKDPLIDLFQTCLSQLGKPTLSVQFTTPNIQACYDDIRPFRIADEKELHGIFDAAWTYLTSALDNRTPPWATPQVSEVEVERIVNDLTEKSIRNMSVAARWQHGAPKKS